MTAFADHTGGDLGWLAGGEGGRAASAPPRPGRLAWARSLGRSHFLTGLVLLLTEPRTKAMAQRALLCALPIFASLSSGQQLSQRGLVAGATLLDHAPPSQCTGGVVVVDLCFGFNSTDSTEMLQAALNSTAHTVVIRPLTTPWFTRPLFLRSHQTVIFEPGVVLRAKRWEFHGPFDALITAIGVQNVTLQGLSDADRLNSAPPVTLRMWRDDYDNQNCNPSCKDPRLTSGCCYSKAEWRHVISLIAVQNVRISGLRLVESGGDGLSIGYECDAKPPCYDASLDGLASDVLIESTWADKNYRQGASVMHARNLSFVDCNFTNTYGTAPMAGVDCEPDSYTSLLDNISFVRCLSANNSGNGFEIAVDRLDNRSAPVTIVFIDCRAEWSTSYTRDRALPQGATSAGFLVAGLVGTRGEISVVRGGVEGADGPGIWIATKTSADTASITFDHTQVLNSATRQLCLPARYLCLNHPAPICVQNAAMFIDIEQKDDRNKLGGVQFREVSVVDENHRRLGPAAMVVDATGHGIDYASISGTLRVLSNESLPCSAKCLECPESASGRISANTLCNATRACQLPNLRLTCVTGGSIENNTGDDDVTRASRR